MKSNDTIKQHLEAQRPADQAIHKARRLGLDIVYESSQKTCFLLAGRAIVLQRKTTTPTEIIDFVDFCLAFQSEEFQAVQPAVRKEVAAPRPPTFKDKSPLLGGKKPQPKKWDDLTQRQKKALAAFAERFQVAGGSWDKLAQHIDECFRFMRHEITQAQFKHLTGMTVTADVYSDYHDDNL